MQQTSHTELFVLILISSELQCFLCIFQQNLLTKASPCYFQYVISVILTSGSLKEGRAKVFTSVICYYVMKYQKLLNIYHYRYYIISYQDRLKSYLTLNITEKNCRSFSSCFSCLVFFKSCLQGDATIHHNTLKANDQERAPVLTSAQCGTPICLQNMSCSLYHV